jgi:hypothetical protein
MRETYTISKTAITLAIKLLRDTLLHWSTFKLPASAELAGTIADQIADKVALQTPQSTEQQVAALTEIM